MKLSASLALWNEVLAAETAAGSSSFRWAMSWAHRGRLNLPLKNRNSASGQYGRVEASGKRRDETRVAPPRSHRMIAAEGGAAGFCMALLLPLIGSGRRMKRALEGSWSGGAVVVAS